MATTSSPSRMSPRGLRASTAGNGLSTSTRNRARSLPGSAATMLGDDRLGVAGETNAHFRGTLDDVGVGEDLAAGGDHHAGSDRLTRLEAPVMSALMVTTLGATEEATANTSIGPCGSAAGDELAAAAALPTGFGPVVGITMLGRAVPPSSPTRTAVATPPPKMTAAAMTALTPSQRGRSPGSNGPLHRRPWRWSRRWRRRGRGGVSR